MSRPRSAQLDDVITGGSFRRELVGDVHYGGARLLEGVPIDDWSLAGDFDAKIKTSASCTIVYQGDFAESVTPREATDALAPFGQELHLYMVVSTREYTERVKVGAYRIDDVPDAYDRTTQLEGSLLTIGSVVQLSLLDRLCTVDTLFRSLEQPASLTSAWAEIARVSRLQVTKTVPDVAIPNSVVYARNRLDTVQQLAAILGGRAAMLSDGTLGIIPDEVGTPQISLTTGEPAGTVIGAGYYMSSREIQNVVIGDFEDDNGIGIHAEAAITSGPLDVNGPFGERVVEYPDDQKQFVRTKAAADIAVKNHLAKVSRRGPYEIPISMVPDPRLEVGDIVSAERPDGAVVGRVVKYSHPRKGAMQITVRTGE